MKKTLLLQTALVAAVGVFAADIASAQTKVEPIAVTVGGYMQRGMKFSNHDSGTLSANQSGMDRRSNAMFGDTEIWFNIRAVLDNGLIVGGRVELEGQSEFDQIDESYAFFDHANYGRMEVGSTDRVATKMVYGAPTAIPGNSTIVFSTEASPILAPGGARTTAPLMRFALGSDDSDGINVYSARYFGSKAGKGLQLGASYSPDGCQDTSYSTITSGAQPTACGGGFSSSTAGSGEVGTSWQVAANYLESFGQVDLALYGAYQGFEIDANQAATAGTGGATIYKQSGLNGWTLGASLTYNVGDGSSVQFGGGYKAEETGSKNPATGLGGDERKVYNVGLRYLTNGVAPGSIGLGVEYSRSKADQGNVVGTVTAGEDKLTWYSAGVTYQLAAGILMYAGAGRYEFKDAVAPTTSLNNDQEATFGVVGFNLTF